MRRGVSLMEVMFAILVVSIGLLAALAVFPVAAHLAKKGEVADMAATAGRSAVHEFDVRGMRQPARWLIHDPLDALRFVNQQPAFGQSYCIDPRGMAANVANPVPNAFFPYAAGAGQPVMVRVTLDRMAVNAAGQLVTTGLPMEKPLADSIFQLDDDLTVERPSDGSLPAFGTIAGGVRSSGGHLSWMATLVPKLELYAVPGVVANSEYILSVVIFHDRPSDMLAGDPMHERIVGADFADAGDSGFAGGEVYLTWAVPQSAANDAFARDFQLHLRAGEWVMLGRMARHVVGPGGGTPFPVFRWYRVTECDSQPEYHAAEGHYAIAASLAGADWDPLPTAAPGGDPTIAVLMEGVVGVYEKTVSLEGPVQ